MALSSSMLGSMIDSNLSGVGANGTKRTDFANALADGIVTYLQTVTFQTNDSGDGTNGSGSGSGITGLSSSSMTTAALGAMSSTGSKASDTMTSIMAAVASHLASDALLTTNNPSVGTGSGIIIIGSFNATISGMANAISTALGSAGANGPKKSEFATAIATGIVNELMAVGTGTVAITGSLLPPGTSGTGTGTIS